jgi:hypothetical protein
MTPPLVLFPESSTRRGYTMFPRGVKVFAYLPMNEYHGGIRSHTQALQSRCPSLAPTELW